MKFQKWIQEHRNHITALSAVLIIFGFIGKFTGFVLFYNIALAIASIIAVIPIMIHAYQAVKVKVISIDLLVTIAVLGAFMIGEYKESAIVTFLFLFGSYLEQKTLTKTRESIKALTEMAPLTASVVQEDGTTEEVEIDDVEEGDIVKISGDDVFSGTILADGYVTIEATKVGDDTTFAKIIELVEEAQDTKSHAEKFIDRFSQYYTPTVLLIALLVGLISRDFRLAITVLVLGCPGALVIGAPVSNVAGIGNGAKRGILVKGGEAMDTFSKIDTFVFDKTGTLTKGTTAVSTIKNYTEDERDSLALVARLETLSDHPLGRAVIHYAQEKDLDFQQLVVKDNQTIKGQGITAEIDGRTVCAGNTKLIAAHKLSLTPKQVQDLHQLQQTGSSVIIVAIDKKITQIIGVSDVIRPEVAEQLAMLKQAGAKHLVMLTGDNQMTADYVADMLGIDEVHAELLPDEKVQFVKKYQEQGLRVAFIGDGINDSPSLAAADIGIAMGSGTDVAIETSDVVLMQSSFGSLVHAYRLAKKTVLNTRENVVIAIGVVLFLLIGLFAGFIYMASGMFVHEASILIVIFNAMRLLYFGHESKEEKS